MFYFCFSAYNEEDYLPPLLDRIAEVSARLNLPCRIVAHDDGSPDATRAILQAEKRVPVDILGTAENYGFGPGILTVIKHVCAVAADDDMALFMDADNTHDPACAPVFMEAIAGGADVVIASRFVPGSRMPGFPLHRRILSRGAAFLFRFVLPFRIRDCTCGFRCYRVSVLKRLLAQYGSSAITSYGFECQLEILSRLPATAVVREIPFVLDYRDRLGHSKMTLFATIRRTMALFFALLRP